MGLKIAETANRREQREAFIETEYKGKNPKFIGTRGEAFFNVSLDTWRYRPFGYGVEFHSVEAGELSCSNDSGWVNGAYTGKKDIKRLGKARWSEKEDAWEYKPNGFPRSFIIPEGEFVMGRDEEY